MNERNYPSALTTLLTILGLAILLPFQALSAVDSPSDELSPNETLQMEDAAQKTKNAKNIIEEKLKVPHRSYSFFVKFKSEIGAPDSKDAAKSISGNKVIERKNKILEGSNIQVIQASSEEELKELMTKFLADERVEDVIPNAIFKKAWDETTGKPVDFNDTNHWYHIETNLPYAYKLQGCGTVSNEQCGGSSSVVVAVLDSGLAFESYNAVYEYYGSNYNLNFAVAPEMNGINLWTNAGEDYGGGDDDTNGYCDDLHGADIVQGLENLTDASSYSEFLTKCETETDIQKEGHPNDDDGHGTFATGIISSLTDNTAGTSFGMVHKVSVMPIKILDHQGSSDLFTIFEGIHYAVSEGAHILNMSIQGDDSGGFLRDAIQYAKDNNVLIVAASGNSNSSVAYPAAYSSQFDNVIAVGASNPDDTRSSYSNYGSSLDLVAPVGEGGGAGNSVWQETYGDADTWGATPLESRDFTTFGYKYWIGTSFAAPQVSAGAVIVLSKNPESSVAAIKNILTTSSFDVSTEGRDDLTGFGILNLESVWSGTWITNWIRNGGTIEPVSMASVGNKLFQAVRGFDSYVWTRVYDDSTSTWSSWTKNGGTIEAVSMASVGNKLFQVVRGFDSYVWTRVYDDSTSTWSSWTKNGGTIEAVSMASVGNKLFQAVRGFDSYVWTRVYDDSTSTWSSWTKNGGTIEAVEMASVGSKLFQAVRGFDSYVWIRNYDNSTSTWSSWSRAIYTAISATMGSSSNLLLQSVVDPGGNVLTRMFNNTESSWGNWIKNGKSVGKVTISSVNGHIFQAARGMDSYAWTRQYN